MIKVLANTQLGRLTLKEVDRTLFTSHSFEYLVKYRNNFLSRVPSLEKIYDKCIPLCSFACFKCIFKTFESFKLLIFPCGALFLFKFPEMLVQICHEKFIHGVTPLVGKKLRPYFQSALKTKAY